MEQRTSKKKPLRVIHFHDLFGRLSENWICNQITGLGDQVAMVYSIDEPGSEDGLFSNVRCFQKDVKGIRRFLNRVAGRLIHRYPQLLFWLMKDRANIVHAHFGPSGNYILPFTRLLRIPLVTSFYGYDAYKLPYIKTSPTRHYRELFRFGQLFLVEGSAMRNKLIELGCPTDKIVIHHIGIDLAHTKFSPRKPHDSIRLLVCGRFVEKKGIPFAIEVLRLVRQATARSICLTVVGDSNKQGSMTPEKELIVATVKHHNLGDAVSFTGFVSRDQLPGLLQNHHILIAPSIRASDGDAEGGFPVIITEALASGMPVVGFAHCDIPEIVRDNKSGFIVPERDVDALAEKLLFLVEHPEIWPEMGRAGREHVEANYDIDKLNDRLVEIYCELSKK